MSLLRPLLHSRTGVDLRTARGLGNYEDRQDHWQNVIGLQMNTLLGRYLARPMEVFELEEVCL